MRISPQGNVKDAQYDVDFFRSFDLVLNGLDNMEARRHVNRLTLAAGTPLVESGTEGYLGQVSGAGGLQGGSAAASRAARLPRCSRRGLPRRGR